MFILLTVDLSICCVLFCFLTVIFLSSPTPLLDMSHTHTDTKHATNNNNAGAPNKNKTTDGASRAKLCTSPRGGATGPASKRTKMCASPTSGATGGGSAKQPSWSQTQLQEAIFAVITQRMRFTQASTRFGIPKGTLYDNILGKSKRLQALEELGLSEAQEMALLEFCCDISVMPYNRRTSRSLRSVIRFVERLIHEEKGAEAKRIPIRMAFRWWWAFCKKYSIISLFFEPAGPSKKSLSVMAAEVDLDEDNFDDLFAFEQAAHPDPHCAPTNPAAPPPAHSGTALPPSSMQFHPQYRHHHAGFVESGIPAIFSPFFSSVLAFPENLTVPKRI